MARISANSQGLPQVEDGFLIALAKQGHADAYDRIVRRYYGFVRLKASSYFLAGGDSEDLIQEGLVGLYKAVRDYRTDRESSFRNFAELCITRQIITAVKTATRNKHSPLNQYVSFSSTPSGLGGRLRADPRRDAAGLDGPRPGQSGDLLRGAARARRVHLDRACPSSNRECSRCTSTATPTRRSGGGWAAIARRSTTPCNGSSARSASTSPSATSRHSRGLSQRDRAERRLAAEGAERAEAENSRWLRAVEIRGARAQHPQLARSDRTTSSVCSRVWVT